MSDDTNNPVFKVTASRANWNTKVSQGSVATRLRCVGIFNDQFISQLPSLIVKEF